MSGPLLLLISTLTAAAISPPVQEVAPPTEAPIARLTRLTDPVAKLDGAARVERALFHWDKVASLRRGDGVRQGPHGLSEIFFPSDRTEFRISGEAHLVVGRDPEGGRVVDVLDMRRFQVKILAEPLTFRLPGGTEVSAIDTSFRLTLDPFDRRHVIRNAGPGEVKVRGPVTPIGEASVLPGHEVEIPLIRDAVSAETVADESWDGVRVQLSDGVRSLRVADGLRLEGTGMAHVGGARIRLHSGHAIHVRRPRRPTN